MTLNEEPSPTYRVTRIAADDRRIPCTTDAAQCLPTGFDRRVSVMLSMTCPNLPCPIKIPEVRGFRKA